jgi:nucleoside-diphosphate-sugar epimerase
MKHKLFITGATGFIGSSFLKRVLELGYEVIAMRRRLSASKIRLAREPIWIERDLSSVKSVDFQGAGTLVHLAAHSANYPYDSLEKCIKYNLVESLELISKARDAGIINFLIAGTAFEYGKSADCFQRVPVEAPLIPVATYPTSKAMAFLAFNQLALEKKINLKYYRIFQVYGEGEQQSRLYPSLKSAAKLNQDLELSAGDQVRDFISVDDVVTKLVMNLDFSNVISGFPIIENLGSGHGQSVRSFAQYQWKALGATGKLSFGALKYRNNELMRLVAG